MEEWLNDTSIDGFLGNLRESKRFIKMDSQWNATMMTDITKPPSTTMIEDPVGLLNAYEYAMSYNGTTSTNGYLNNGLIWWTLTPYSSQNIQYIFDDGNLNFHNCAYSLGIRPSINLRSEIKIVSGSGTESDPYRLMGDNDANVSGTLLNTRYSGEYIRFGTGENNLYRIVSHENGIGTKVTSATPLKENGNFKMIQFDSSDSHNINYSNSITVGIFLNGEYLNNYINSEYSDMIEENTTWYLGTVADGTNYKLAKYKDKTGNILTSSTTTAKVGLLRLGELMSAQFNRAPNNTNYWTLTPHADTLWYVYNQGNLTNHLYSSNPTGIKPALNIKSNVIITKGDGTMDNPFELSVQ